MIPYHRMKNLVKNILKLFGVKKRPFLNRLTETRPMNNRCYPLIDIKTYPENVQYPFYD